MKTVFAKAKLFIIKFKVPIIFVLVNIIVSLIVHWPLIREITWDWRPAQTLLTTFWFKQEGISLFAYQTPLFGPPWQVPLEFPLYQAICTIISNIFSISIITASHLTSLFVFFISSIFLLLTCYEYFDDIFTACVIFTVYLWLPYNFIYSNEILIDYLALTFALGFIYLAMKWFAKPDNLFIGVLAIIFLCLGSLVKITTMPIVFVSFTLLLIRGLKNQGFKFEFLFQPKELLLFFKTHRTFFVMLLLMVIVPLSITLIWINHTDSIKLASPFTAWLSSSNLKDWNFGTLSEKLNLLNWWNWASKIGDYFFFGVLIVFSIISASLIIKSPSKTREIIISSVFGSILTIFIFFNLYLHEYYYISISAFMSILIGYGLSWTIQFLNKQSNIWLSFIFLIVFGVCVIVPGYTRFKEFRHKIDFYHTYIESKYNDTAQKAKAITPIDGYIISIQEDWEPFLVLAAERKAFILNPRNRELFTCAKINDYPYLTVIGPPDSPDTKTVLACFDSYQQIKSKIFRVYK